MRMVSDQAPRMVSDQAPHNSRMVSERVSLKTITDFSPSSIIQRVRVVPQFFLPIHLICHFSNHFPLSFSNHFPFPSATIFSTLQHINLPFSSHPPYYTSLTGQMFLESQRVRLLLQLPINL